MGGAVEGELVLGQEINADLKASPVSLLQVQALIACVSLTLDVIS